MIDRSIIANNFWWKLTSVALATIVWITFHNEVRFEGQAPRGINDLIRPRGTLLNNGFPVSVMRAPGDFREFRLEPPAVEVLVSGEQGVLRRAVEEELQVFVDLTKAGNEPFTARVKVSLPAGIRLEKITPDEVHVELVKQASPR